VKIRAMDIAPYKPIQDPKELLVATAFQTTLRELDSELQTFELGVGMQPNDDYQDDVAALYSTEALPHLTAAMASHGPDLLAAAQTALEGSVGYSISNAPVIINGPGLPDGTYAPLVAVDAYVDSPNPQG
jgi:hypothetical protein